MKISVNEIFKSIQGEGIYTGCPSVFVRLNGCNLRCAFANGSICDTPYTSWNPEKCQSREVEEVSNQIVELLGENCYHVVFTGGEPMLQQKAMIELIHLLDEKCNEDITYTIETNGSIIVNPDCRELYYLIDLFSVSPKLDNSACFKDTNLISQELQEKHNRERFNPCAIYDICNEGLKVQLKFVYSNDETENHIKKFFEDLYDVWKNNKEYEFPDIIKERSTLEQIQILIMPEGSNEEEMRKSAPDAVEACLRNGWRYCHRVHIGIWGNKRGV